MEEAPRSDHKKPRKCASIPTAPFCVKGQQGTVPLLGLGTATLKGERCAAAVAEALRLGYTHIDTALLYGNQAAVGEGIRRAGAARRDVWVTSKVAFFPSHENPDLWMFSADNVKGDEARSVELSLGQLGLDFVDLLLAHNGCTQPEELVPMQTRYTASSLPHFFELKRLGNSPDAIKPVVLSDGSSVRGYLMAAKLAEAKATANLALARARRKTTWHNLEKLKEAGKARFIGVSNYPAELLLEMKEYATIMPAVNQLEFHPRFASPTLRKVAAELGVLLTGYGTGMSVKIGKELENLRVSKVVSEVATKAGKSPMQVVLRWTVQSGVVAIPRTADPVKLQDNLSVFDWELSSEAMAALDALNEDYPYYWSPVPTLCSV